MSPFDRDADHGFTQNNIEAEQALLGALLYDPAAFAMVDGLVTADHFGEPYHGAMFAEIARLVGSNQLADPIVVAESMKAHKAFEQTGGLQYLADLVDRAPPARNAPDYAGLVRDTWQRKELVAFTRQFGEAARKRTDVPLPELIQDLEAKLLAINTSSRSVRLVSAADAVERTLNELENPAASHGVELGLEPLDKAIGGIHPGEMWLLAARPSMGKSALASCAALHVARHGQHPDGRRLGVIEINGEMTIEQMTRRHITDWAFELSPQHAPAYSSIRARELTEEQHRLVRIAGANVGGLTTLKMVKRTGMTLSTLRGLIRRQVAAWEREGIRLGLVTIDHVGLLRPDRETRGRYEAQTDVAIDLKEMADELQVPFLALVQLSRQLESRDDKRPTLPDLRDSGAWEENADGVIGVYRDAYYAQRELKPKKDLEVDLWESRKGDPSVEAILLKIREGAAGNKKLWGVMPRTASRADRPIDDGRGFDFYGAEDAIDRLRADVAATARPKIITPASTAAIPDLLEAASATDAAGDQVVGDGRPTPPDEAYDVGEFA